MYLVSVQTQNPFKLALLAGTVLASISLAGVASAQSVGAQSLGNAGSAGSAGLTAIALPSGGKVTAGQAQIISSGSATTINQSSNKAILTWDQFSIGQGGLVQFNNGNGATLNRVIGTSLSSIDGRLSASGTVYLINPNGIVIGTKGIVDTGGSFVASTQNITDANFLSGGPQQFTGTSTASVINLGKVSSLGGNVALIATKVSNEGQIAAANGTAGLLAGTSVLLRDSALDDGLFLVQAGGADTAVTQKGAIDAAAAELKAQNGSVYALAGNTASYIKATGTGTKGGQIWLLAGADGTTTVSGTNLTATNGDKGGFIETSGGTVKVADDVSIATKAANGAFGTWLIDPNDLTIAPTGGFMSGAALSTALAANNVTLKSNQGTTAGNGDIFINDTVTWSSSSKLTLDAYRNININNVITVAGAGGVNLIVGDQAQNGTGDATKGDYGFGLTGNGFAGRLDYTGTGGSLFINGEMYTLLYNLTDFEGIDYSKTNGIEGKKYALARNIDTLGKLYDNAIVYTFSGILSGLGHNISNINIESINQNAVSYTGVIGVLNYSSIVRDFGVSLGRVSGFYAGGLAGLTANSAKILNSYANVNVNGNVPIGWYAGPGYTGGLVGDNYGLILNSFSSGSITYSDQGTWLQAMFGGLAGINHGTISGAFASGPVSAFAVTNAGGLVGTNYGAITNAFASGAVTGRADCDVCSYATVGGLVGSNYGSLTNTFATGRVVSNPIRGGGLVGPTEYGQPNTSSVINGYWDTATSGFGTTFGGGTGYTTTQLQSALPAGFDQAIWGGGGGLYPYLKAFGAPKPITGFAYEANGTGSKGATVYFITDGVQRASVLTGANGYYYYANQGAVPFTATKLGATLTLANASEVSGAFASDSVSLFGSKLSNFNIRSGNLVASTTKTSLALTLSDLNTVFGPTLFSALLGNSAISKAQFSASTAFTIDSVFTSGKALVFEAKNGSLTLASGSSVSSTATGDAVTLASNGAFINNAGASAISTPSGRWLIYTTTPDGSTTDVIGGLVGKNYYGSAYTFGTGFAKAPTSGNRFVHAYRPILTVTGDVKTATYTGATQGFTYTLTGYRPGDQAIDILTGSAITAKTASKNVGTYTQNTTTNFVSDLNYGFSYISPAIINITPAPLTLAAVTDTKTYDATATSTKAVLKTGLKGSDTVTGLTQAFDSKNAGARTLAINQGYVINDGNGGANYAPTVTTASGTINKAPLTFTAVTDSKTYDTTTSSVGTVTFTGFKGGDWVSNLTQAFDSKNAGSRTLKVNTDYIIYDDANGGNYQVTLKAASGTINKASLNLYATGDTKVYDATTVSSLIPYAVGFLGNDAITNFTQAFNTKNAGYAILSVKPGYVISDGNNGNNYAITINAANGQITPAPLTLAAVTDTKTYDTTTTSTKGVQKIGLKGTDTVSSLSQAFDNPNASPYALGSTISVNPGYVVNDGNGGNNYTVNVSSAQGTINKAPLTFTTVTDTKTYDGTTYSAGSVTVTGLKGYDSVNGLTQAFNSKNAGSRTLIVNPGFTIYDGNNGSNYQVTYKTAVGTINKAPLTLAAVTDSKAYDGKTTSIGVVQIYGLLGTDKITSLAQVFDSAAKGNRKLSVKTGYVIDDGNGGKNYSVVPQKADGVIY
jgi:filamentous hemagglutinin family protein